MLDKFGKKSWLVGKKSDKLSVLKESIEKLERFRDLADFYADLVTWENFLEKLEFSIEQSDNELAEFVKERIIIISRKDSPKSIDAELAIKVTGKVEEEFKRVFNGESMKFSPAS